MEFIHPQETLTAMQWILRAVVSYIFLLIVVKVMGQRSISQLSLLDFAIAITIGNIIAHPLSDKGLGLKGSMITMAAFAVLYSTSVFAVLKSGRVRNFVLPRPIPLVEKGQLVYPNLKKARITIDYLLSEARKAKIEDLETLALALWEPDGTISFFESPQYQGPTRSDFNMTPEPFDLPVVVVREGRVDKQALQWKGKDEAGLLSILKEEHDVRLQDVLLATMDRSGRVKVFVRGR
ncbi:DUF421 domain-containing protein [Bhargavaea beijingensis]|uniref:DUF421 domain-containing protein n=1 Tax=Bhargavaea beijingensis TaxID=426756 RepID=A0A1G7A7L3_9BACL|nr:DUF421 domain-containing protein [Bhargavaea beijingensis]MCW1927325.1 DUF421 domain-containing protein [Bhargavaea beijingensis]RSK35550.1 DUF421 domain-containing protein [Bhargavaea beijingensis]SDE10918.1 Uncharacterized membrane protein YcaP, DUF421 family [Bhargavaea beijingensis]